jgi:uncharacterized protein YbcV (DUF1398 family)
MKFTKEQIDSARAKVKTGADFPKEIKEFKRIGITKYEFFLKNGVCIYYADDDFSLETESEYAISGVNSLEISSKPSLKKFRIKLLEHQKGISNFQTFCKLAADLGVNKWISDLIKMTCTYYDSSGKKMHSEKIPEVT